MKSLKKSACMELPKLCLLTAIIAAGSYAQTVVRQVVLPGKVRDFKEWCVYNAQADKPGPLIAGGHPDFEHYQGNGCKGAVEKRIDTTNMASTFPYDNRGPKLVGNGCGGFFAGPQYFKNWYNDTTINDSIRNRPFLIPLHFNLQSDCKMAFMDYIFFPLDSAKEKYSLTDPAQPTFGYLQTSYPDHVYGFTLEFHSWFTYFKGTNQTFSFLGDDDVWVYVKDSLVIDLGGLHSAQGDSVNLDMLPTGFLKDGGRYMLDFFSAERHTFYSNIRITTSIILGNEGDQLDTTITCFGMSVPIAKMAWLPKWYTNWATPPVFGVVIDSSTGMPMAGVTIVFSNGGGSAVTDGAGSYSVNLPRHWSGTVTASKPNIQFSTPTVSVADITIPTRKNFTGIDTTLHVGLRTSLPNVPSVFGVNHTVTGADVDFAVSVEKPCAYTLSVYDIAGRCLWTTREEQTKAGVYRVSWKAPVSSANADGIYFVKLLRNDARIANKFSVIR